jgi:hypothetical protein
MSQSSDAPQSRGGNARASKLSKSERSAIAKKAAQERWSSSALPAIAGSDDKPLSIGGVEIECYVLEGGTRVVTQRSFMRAIGRGYRSGEGTDDLPPFLASRSIRSYLTPEIIETSKPVTFTLPRGGRAKGYQAELLPAVCELYLKARQDGVLPYNQERVAAQAEILVRGLAQVGIIALVDEATGYQDIRARDALATILETFIAKELQAYVRTFPDDYYRELFRLRSLKYEDVSKRPQYFGVLTNDIVYKRIAPGVLDELKRVQRKGSTGRPKDKLFQHLTTNAGYPKLREHLGSVVTLMKMSSDWDSFKVNLDRIHPKYDETIPIDYEKK